MTQRFASRAAKSFHWLCLLGCLMLALCGAPAFAESGFAVRSRSDQFIIQGPRETLPSVGFPNTPSVGTNLIRLEQARLAVICERVKQALLQELGAPDRWRGRIFLQIYPAKGASDPVLVKATFTNPGWVYRMEVPSEVAPMRLLAALVEVILQEIAGRNAGPRELELPPWLAPGMTAYLNAVTSGNLIVEADKPMMGMYKRNALPYKFRDKLGGRVPLNFDELNWPDEEWLQGPPGNFYEACAHLFIYQLLRLRDGGACLAQFLSESPRHLNWQTAFLKAFAQHFASLRDVEKWWSLHLVAFSGRDPSQAFSLAESQEKLGEILSTPVRVHSPTNRTTFRVEMSLQDIISGWEPTRQKPLLRQKILQLQALRLRVSPHLLTLTEDYRQTLVEYLDRREKSLRNTSKNSGTDSPKLAVRSALERLLLLDDIRLDLNKQAARPGPAEVGKPGE
ncbi:MAG: hypothetical protein WCO56_13985 [Verrucomicrobiota bacterium]